jgi:hypothetical protein
MSKKKSGDGMEDACNQWSIGHWYHDTSNERLFMELKTELER